jgi:hypothetical protein
MSYDFQISQQQMKSGWYADRDDIICPYCEHIADKKLPYDFSIPIPCDKCGNDFSCTKNVVTTYSTKKIIK